MPARHELRVEMTVPAVPDELLRLDVPTWVPGDYDFVKLGRDLFDLQAKDVDTGKLLPITRAGWQSFRVHCQGDVQLTYRASAFARDFAETSGFVDSDCAVLLGARYLRAGPGPQRVTYHVPKGWPIHHPAGAKQVGPSAWLYPSYEILLDTPVVLGRFDLIKRRVRGTDFFFLFVDRAPGFESQAQSFASQVAAVAEKCYDVFGSFPFPNYTFVLSTDPANEWGLEHLTSTMCGLGPDVFIDPKQTAFGNRVCAHELFHAWNVRTLRPAPLKNLDLTGGSFTEGLWLAEGFTRYYEFLLCTRIGTITPEQFFSSVVNYHRYLTATPAYERVSAVDSSLATYLNHNKYPGRCNNSIDYYDKGMLIAFDLDAALRLTTRADSLDRAFRSFYKKYVNARPGYTTEQVIDFFDKRRRGLGKMLARAVAHPAGLSVISHLKQLGFEVGMESVHTLGLMFLDDGPAIYNVLDTSPAGRAGITPGDVLSRVNGFPHSMKLLTWAARRPDKVTLEVRRGQRTLTFQVTGEKRRQIGALVWSGTSLQARRIAAWLKRKDFRPRAGQRFNLDYYENFHGKETVV